jgi:LacI family repressor for deo operon, udp, cdd, tsx, nupC, and nupG
VDARGKIVDIGKTGSGRHPTMADVARRAEVSTATVSYYLSGRAELLRRIGADAQQRIADAVAELGYMQNKAARHLRLQKTERICVLLPRLGIPFADKIARDVDEAARARGYSIIVVTGETPDVWRRVIRDVEAGLADGLIGDADMLTEDELNALFAGRLTKPRVVLHPNARPTSFSVVNYDRLTGLESALDLLRADGRRRIAYVHNTWRRHNERIELVRGYALSHADAI